jgi:amidase
MALGFFEVDPEVQKNTLAALEVFRSLGATVEEVDLGWTHTRRLMGVGLPQSPLRGFPVHTP